MAFEPGDIFSRIIGGAYGVAQGDRELVQDARIKHEDANMRWQRFVDSIIEPLRDVAVANANIQHEVVPVLRIDAFYLQESQVERCGPSAGKIYEALHGRLFEVDHILSKEKAQVSPRECEIEGRNFEKLAMGSKRG